MKTFYSKWNAIQPKFHNAPFRLFLFDVDGTLAPIAPTPRQARIPQPVRRGLAALAKEPKNWVGIISGRSLKEARQMVPVRGLIYAGNHGLEICGKGKTFVHPGAKSRAKHLGGIRRALQKNFQKIKGLLIEDKGLSLSVHYRLVKNSNIQTLKNSIQNFVRSIDKHKYFSVREGKKVMEVRPRISWNKGSALKTIRRWAPKNTIVVYVGDDTTDEDAFRILSANDFGIRVGEKQTSHATLYLNSQKGINSFLQRLVKI